MVKFLWHDDIGYTVTSSGCVAGTSVMVIVVEHNLAAMSSPSCPKSLALYPPDILDNDALFHIACDARVAITHLHPREDDAKKQSSEPI